MGGPRRGQDRKPVCPFDVVVLAGSAGGLRAVMRILETLPSEFPAAVVVALHRSEPAGPDLVPTLLARRAALPVRLLLDARDLLPGVVGVLPAGSALCAVDGGLEVRPVESRRTLDSSLTAVARVSGHRCLAVVLSGRLDDGAAGVRSVKRAGGRVIVQDPAGADQAAMPTAALATGSVDFVIPLERVAASLVALTMAPGAAEMLQTVRAAWAT